MTRIPWFLHSWMLYSAIVTSIHSTEYDPLIFNPHTLEIYNLDEVNSNQSDCQPCAVACPDKNEAEDNFEKVTHRYDSVFIQKVFAEQQVQNIHKMKCKRGFELNVLLHSKKGGKLVEFGFQVYFEKSRFRDEQIVSNNFYKFSRVINGESTLERMWSWQENHLVAPWGRRKSTIRQWGFLWISKIEVRYNFSSRILTSLRYKVRPIQPEQLDLTCLDYELFGVWYNINHRMNVLYEDQHKIFNKVKIPEGSCRQSNKGFECVKKHNLVLPYQFQASSPNKISCSNITSIPLWNEVPDALMDRIQMFIIAIAQALGEKRELIVLSGVLGQLTLPSATDEKPIKIYLNEEDRKVPVPMINYKIVRYRSHKCDEKKRETCWFDVVIVIQNHPIFVAEEKLCPVDDCGRLGWDSIQYLNSDKLEKDKSPFVYCCELTRSVAKSLSFPLGKTINKLLHLKVFPVYSHSLQKFDYVEILKDVEAEFKKLVDLRNNEK